MSILLSVSVLFFCLPVQAATPLFTNQFTLPTNSPSQGVAVDLTGDNIPELLTSSGAYAVLTNRTFTNLFLFGDNVFPFTIGDLNNDGRVDVLRGQQLWYGTGTGGFAFVTNYPSMSPHDAVFKIVVGDVNGDGSLDACYAHNYSADVWTNHAGELIFSQHILVTARFFEDIAIADFNGDHVSDIALILGSGRVQARFYFGSTNGGPAESLTNVLEYPNYDYPTVATGDFNSDGFADLVIGGQYRTNVTLLCGTNSGVMNPISVPAMQPMRLRIGDWDGDGYEDILAQFWSNSRMGFLRSRGDGTFDPEVQLQFSTNESDPGIYIGAVFDFDRDGRFDLIGLHESTPTVWRNTTPGTTNSPALNIQRGVDGVVVSWLRSGFGFFRLQCATNVIDGAAWNDVLGITKLGDKNYFTNRNTHLMQAYRLRQD